MPSNVPTKTSGSKNQTKLSASKNATNASNIKDVKPMIAQGNPMEPAEITDLQQPVTKISPVTVSADQLPPNALQDNADEASSGVSVNKKKQKRRQKEAARKAAEQPHMTGSQLAQKFANVADSAYQDIVKEMAAAQARGGPNGYDYGGPDYDDPEQYEPEQQDVVYYRDHADPQYQDEYAPQTNGHAVHDYVPQDALGGKVKKKKKTKASSTSQDAYLMDNPSLATQRPYQPPPPPPPPPLNQHLPSGLHRPMHNESRDRIWNTSTAEERERIKDFWLSLGEEDRRSLVKVEKEAVLKKMKEQQKHSCSCTVCGRKRTAIEEELEVLYDAYYEELEVYANPTHGSHEDKLPPRIYAHPMARMPQDRHPQMHQSRSSRGRIQEIGDDEDAGDEEDYSDDEDSEDISEEEVEEQNIRPVPNGGTDFFNFGKSLTVQGGILTVADDLLKNDGKKFIEMMEQLAERRMQREEDQYARAAEGTAHPPLSGHNHSQSPEDDGYDEEEDDEEYDEDEEEFDGEDEMESMTEVERMQEGRRMFQIFAARMFEQRVLTAYREKVALERQKKLLEELDDENRVDAQREAKKAKEAQKKKDKKRQQKEAKDAERAKRDADKAAEEAAAKALEEKKAEEVRQRKEEQRRKKEAEKKVQEEEKQRKEAEKLKRIQEAKEQQAEQERKQREQKDRDKKKRDETKRKEREDRESKEKEVKERKEREAAERREREATTKADNEANERIKQHAQLPTKRQSPAMPPGLHPPLTTSSHTSPRLQIATPVVPKAPTPVRPRQLSFRDAHNISPKTSQPTSSSATTSPTVSSAPQHVMPGKSIIQATNAQRSQTPSRYSPAGPSPGQPILPPGLSNLQQMHGSAFTPNFGPPLSPTAQQPPHYPNHFPVGNGPSRNLATPNGMSYAPAMNGSNQMPPGRGSTMGPPLPNLSTGGLSNTNANDLGRYGMSRDNIPSQTHSRNTSASFGRCDLEIPGVTAQTQPIARPAPIKRPSSVTPHQQAGDIRPLISDVDDLSNHLGSSALLDDTDISFSAQSEDSRRGSMAPGTPRIIGHGFGANPGFPNPPGSARMENFSRALQVGNGKTWTAQQMPFGAPPMSGMPSWSNGPGFGRANNNNGFGSIGGSSRPSGSRAVTIRLLVSTACEKLTARSPPNQNPGWHRADDVLREVQVMKPGHEAPVSMQEMLDICDTEGNGQNGGGSFAIHSEDQVGLLIRFDSGRNTSVSRGVGDIGSPIVGGAMPIIGGQRAFQQPGGF